MGRRMRIRAGDVEMLADLRDTPTVDALWMMLPLSSRATRWGDEFYFQVSGVLAESEPDARAEMEVGEVGFWVEGGAVAVFFGPTPASRADEPRAVAPVNVLGKVRGDARAFDRLSDGVTFHLDPVDDRGVVADG